MKLIIRVVFIFPCLILLVFLSASSQTRPANVKALVGGTLIDGYGSTPIRNSVVIMGLATAPEYPADIIAMIRERTAKMSLGPLFWTPTVQGLLNYEYVRDNPEQLDDPSWQVGLPQSIVDDIKQSLKNPGQLSYYQITPQRRPTLARKISQLSECEATSCATSI